ncbi:hypothetical protein HYX58_01280 [Candidatus Dependentiae bacterium]|nr:hypothetical protein [Candidatus Dependentiae bacterium]
MNKLFFILCISFPLAGSFHLVRMHIARLNNRSNSFLTGYHNYPANTVCNPHATQLDKRSNLRIIDPALPLAIKLDIAQNELNIMALEIGFMAQHLNIASQDQVNNFFKEMGPLN